MNRNSNHALNQSAFWSPEIAAEFDPAAEVILSHGDCLPVLRRLPGEQFKLIITSPPYNLGKAYEEKLPFDEYLTRMEPIIDECARVLSADGSLCWQVGSYVEKGEVFPLDVFFYQMLKRRGLKLRNRMIWHYEHGQHAKYRFSGRYETLLWFTKGDDYTFNLDDVRVPSKYPHKKHFRGPRYGQLSGHPLGKNPGDVWELKVSGEQTAFPVESHRFNVTTEAFHDFSGFVELIVRKLASAAAQQPDERAEFLQAVPHQANLLYVGGHPYTTITIERSARALSVEFGRNHWTFACNTRSRKTSERGPIERYSFAVHAQREGSPLVILLNFLPGFPLPSALMRQLAVFRRLTYGEAGMLPPFYASLSDYEADEISLVRTEAAKIFLVESFLALALQHSRVPVPQRQPGLFGPEFTARRPSAVTLVHELASEEGVNTWQIIKNDWEAAFWEIPNVKAGHAEKTIHPCQFPIELVERCVLALTNENDRVLDPFAGAGSAVVAALRRRRRAMGCEKEERFIRVARQRVADFYAGRLGYRPLGKPVAPPRATLKVRAVPPELLEL
ncbi:MAG TPA: DNA methyltransferase [Blastocatellia bacterium]|nr:DNA methyltransferase [Blastocatellia bacterium]